MAEQNILRQKGPVWCEVVETELENDDGLDVDGVRAECSRCGHQTESFGTHEKSIARCLVLLREECPRGEANFYADAASRGQSRPGSFEEKVKAGLASIYGEPERSKP